MACSFISINIYRLMLIKVRQKVKLVKNKEFSRTCFNFAYPLVAAFVMHQLSSWMEWSPTGIADNRADQNNPFSGTPMYCVRKHTYLLQTVILPTNLPTVRVTLRNENSTSLNLNMTSRRLLLT